MFKIFKRRRDDVIDLVSLQKRGIIQQNVKKQPVTAISSTDSTDSSALGFLGNLAGASSESTTETDSESGYLTLEQKKARLRTRIFDMQDRIDKHAGELHDIKNTLDVIEKRLERLERKTGVKELDTY